MLRCDRCLRSIGLWLYKKESKNQEGSENVKSNDKEDSSNINSNNKRTLEDNLTELSEKKSKDSKNRELNPLREHFNWCPWLTQLDTSLAIVDTSNNSNKIKRADKNPCLVVYEIVCKRLNTPQSSESEMTNNDQAENHESSLSNSNSSPRQCLDSAKLMDRAKSAHSLLINCASLYNLK